MTISIIMFYETGYVYKLVCKKTKHTIYGNTMNLDDLIKQTKNTHILTILETWFNVDDTMLIDECKKYELSIIN